MHTLTRIIRANTAFTSLADMWNTDARYRPSLDMDTPGLALVADAYDAAQAARGDARRAWRYGTPSLSTLKANISLMNAMLREEAKRDFNVVRTRTAQIVAGIEGRHYRLGDAYDVRGSRITLSLLRKRLKVAQEEMSLRGLSGVATLSICIGIDGADSLRDMMEGVYEPWVVNDSIDVPSELLA